MTLQEKRNNNEETISIQESGWSAEKKSGRKWKRRTFGITTTQGPHPTIPARIHKTPQNRHTRILTTNLTHCTHLKDMGLELMEVEMTGTKGIEKGDEKVRYKDCIMFIVRVKQVIDR